MPDYNNDTPIREEWIVHGVTNEAVNWSNGFGQFLAKKGNNAANLTQEQQRQKALSTSKLRKFFGAFKRIQADPENRINELPMLKAYLAYDVGRDLKRIRFGHNDFRTIPETRVDDFSKQISIAIDLVERGESDTKIIRFKNFAKIVESV